MVDNKITNNTAVEAYGSNSNVVQKENKKTEEKQVEQKNKEAEQAAVYEKTETDASSKSATYSINKMSPEDREALVKQLKSEQENRQKEFISLVQKMLHQQSTAANIAGIDLDSESSEEDEDSIWKFLAKGDFTVDEATKKKAQEDISEDGYYGVKQTSQRIFDFACALAGDDVEKMKAMQKAFQKGYDEAAKAWGKELPDISKKTLEATNALFDAYYQSKASEDTTETVE